jgi:hypothetical protein
MPRMTATGTARVLGALITAWLVSEAASSFASSQLHQVMLFGLLACPAIAVAFSLPRTSFSAYLGIGLALAAFVAVIRGIAGPPDPRQELTGGEEFIVGFLFSAFFSLFGLTLGGLAFSLVRTSLGVTSCANRSRWYCRLPRLLSGLQEASCSSGSPWWQFSRPCSSGRPDTKTLSIQLALVPRRGRGIRKSAT